MLIYLSLLESEADRIKFIQIYEQYRYTMLYTAMKILKNQSLAEDAVHNACLKIINHIEELTDISSRRTQSFIVIITKHVAIDILRKEQKMTGVPWEDAEEFLPDHGDGPLQVLLSEQGYERLLNAIARLDEIHKTVLQLKYIHEYSSHEIAGLLDISPDNVNLRVHRARKHLKVMLEEGEDID